MAVMVNGIGGGGGGDLSFSTRQITIANISGVTGSGIVARMGNLVHIIVRIDIARGSSILPNATVATIPEGFRPIQKIQLEFSTSSSTSTGVSFIDLDADGTMVNRRASIGSSSYATYFDISQFYMTAEPASSATYGTDDGGIMTWEDITPLINWQTGKAFILDSTDSNDRHLNFLHGGSTEGVRYTTINVLPGEFYRVSGWYVASEINPTGGNGKVNYGVVAGFLNSNNYLIDYKVANSSGDHTFLPNWEFRTTEFRVPPSATKLVIMNYNQAILSYVLRDSSSHERLENTEIVHPLTDTIIERASSGYGSGAYNGSAWKNVTGQLSSWEGGLRLGTRSYDVGQNSYGGKIDFEEWNSTNNRWMFPGSNTYASGGEGEGNKYKHAYMDVSPHQVYRMTAWVSTSTDYTVAFYRSDGSILLAVRHYQDRATHGSLQNSQTRSTWNRSIVSASGDTKSAGLATGIFIVPANATRMYVQNEAELYDQPYSDFILERLAK